MVKMGGVPGTGVPGTPYGLVGSGPVGSDWDGNRDAISIDSNRLLLLLGKLIASRFPYPTGLCFSAERGLHAVATKPGTVYLISVRSRLESENGPSKDRIATSAEPTRR